MARKGSALTMTVPESSVGITLAASKRQIYTIIHEIYLIRWTPIADCRHANILFTGPTRGTLSNTLTVYTMS